VSSEVSHFRRRKGPARLETKLGFQGLATRNWQAFQDR